MNHKWLAQNIPDLSGKTAVVTGSNSGIGFETAKELARHGAHTILACRNLDKAQAALTHIQTELPSANTKAMQLDLGNLASIRSFAQTFAAQHDQLDLLINNAGVMVPPYGTTSDNFELQFGTNHLGHFALTSLLYNQISKSKSARIVVVSSIAHRYGQINFDDLQSEQKYTPMQAYSQSKLANLLFAYELQRRATASNTDIIIAAAHPGWTATDLQRHTGSMNFATRLIGQSQSMGALPSLYAATAPDVQGSGYYGPGGLLEFRGHPKKVKSSERSHDQTVAKRLWTVSEELTGVEFSL